jgi:hypothetical protein
MTISEVSLVISLYTVFGTALNPVIGKLGDIVGKTGRDLSSDNLPYHGGSDLIRLELHDSLDLKDRAGHRSGYSRSRSAW